MRSRRLMLNSIFGLLQQIITIVCGFVLPRYMLGTYGSEINGLASSVTQFLGFISFLQLGVGAVIQAAWYKPLADGDNDQVSRIYISAERFFRKIALIFVVYTAVLCVVYPYWLADSFDFLYTASLILVISVSLFIQYYFGITNQLLLYADQRAYIYLMLQSGLVVLNTIASVVMMELGASIQMVKLGAAMIYAISPLVMNVVVQRSYQINKKLVLTEEPIQQKWNGFAQHISSVVMDNSSVMILTLFSTLSNISIYYVYHLVVYGIRQLIVAVTVGIQSLFGNLLAKNEKEKMAKTFDETEALFHYMVTLLYVCVTILIVPFVQVYTADVNDANYEVPLFAVLISIGYALYCYRLPYYAVIKAAGHFKQTQLSAFAEMFINIVISVATVLRFGLVGIAIGTLVANLYRTIYFVVYLKKHILQRGMFRFVKLSLLDIACFICCMFLTQNLMLDTISYFSWIILAVKVFVVCLMVCSVLFALGNLKVISSTIKSKKIIIHLEEK